MSRHVQTTEATGKSWKLLQLVGVLGILTGAALFFVGLGGDETNHLLAGICAGAVGVPVYAVGRVGAWWFHG